MRREVIFTSEGANLSGWFYAPDCDPPWPLVIMAHGFSATRGMIADEYAKVLHGAGLAVLLYDHRGFGASGGQPRLQVNPWIQARGYRDAISYAAGTDGVDPYRIALWGDSLSGGVALAVAGVDQRVAALAVQVPSIGTHPPPEDPDGAMYREFRETILTGNVDPGPDEIQGPMPVVSDDWVRRPSALQPLTAYRWFIEHGGRLGSEWVNNVTRAASRTPIPWNPGLVARHVTCPSLFVVAPEDEMPGSTPSASRAVFETLHGPKEWLDVDGGHFGLLYVPSPAFDRASATQARFFVAQLGGRNGRLAVDRSRPAPSSAQ